MILSKDEGYKYMSCTVHFPVGKNKEKTPLNKFQYTTRYNIAFSLYIYIYLYIYQVKKSKIVGSKKWKNSW